MKKSISSGCRMKNELSVNKSSKYGSWLNIAECELSAMTRQCLKGRRIAHLSDLQRELEAWATQTNNKQRIVDWQFEIDDARSKLKRLYPKFKPG